MLHGGIRALTQASKHLVAEGGHFLDLGKASEMENLQSDSHQSAKSNIAYSTIELQHLAFSRPKLVQKMLLEVVDMLVQDGRPLNEIVPILSVPLGGITEAFNLMSTAQHVGKLVIQIPSGNRGNEGFKDNESYLIVGGVR